MAVDGDDAEIHGHGDKSVHQMFSKPLRVGLLVEPTVRACVRGRIWLDSVLDLCMSTLGPDPS